MWSVIATVIVTSSVFQAVTRWIPTELSAMWNSSAVRLRYPDSVSSVMYVTVGRSDCSGITSASASINCAIL